MSLLPTPSLAYYWVADSFGVDYLLSLTQAFCLVEILGQENQNV